MIQNCKSVMLNTVLLYNHIDTSRQSYGNLILPECFVVVTNIMFLFLFFNLIASSLFKYKRKYTQLSLSIYEGSTDRKKYD
jgi:hypothetical protein